LRQRYDLEIRWVPFPLHPETPPVGLALADFFRGRNVDLAASRARLGRLMAAEGLPYDPGDRLCNTRLAQELARWADDHGGGAIHDALFRAYFVGGADLADVETLVRIAGSVGLPAAEARDVLVARRWRETVDADWERAGALGITAVPTFVVGRRGVAGAQPFEVLEQLVVAAGARRRE
jgi:predicted DsbA family dithiol-disulfide isomerase